LVYRPVTWQAEQGRTRQNKAALVVTHRADTSREGFSNLCISLRGERVTSEWRVS